MRNKVLNLVGLLSVIVLMSSCWQFNRDQRYKNAENAGKSALIEATSSKQIQIEEARGLAEASELKAKSMVNIAKAEALAEVERAKGVAEANQIIGQSLKGNKEYLEYLKIDGIKNLKAGDRIYIPTEATLPITEARR